MPEIVTGRRIVGILDQLLEQEGRAEDVDAHRCQRVVRAIRHGRRLGRLFDEIDDPFGIIHVHDPEALRFIQRHLNAANGQVGFPFGVVGQHQAVVHLVDMITRQHDDVLRIALPEDVQILINRVGRSGVPPFLHALLRRHHIDELTQLATQKPPPLLNMADQRIGLVLGEDADLANT